MAAKKYLSLEEAAQVLGVRTDEVIRLREKGDLRGFADRGTWKFKADDVEETKRRRQPDSNPDVSLIGDDDSALDEGPLLSNTSDSDVRLVMGDDLKTRLTGSSGDVPVFKPKKGSDSDVQLVGAPAPKKKSDSDVKLIKSGKPDGGMNFSDSDSDVRLAAPGKSGKGDSSARPLLSDSDSDVRLTSPSGMGLGSDSDVRLAAPLASDSDVKLVDPRKSGRSAQPDDDRLDLDVSESILLDDSGIEVGKDSGIRLTGDSSLRLAGESGIQLRRPQDSGILLERPGDSGFRLADDDDVAFKLAEDSGIKVGEAAPKSTSKLKKQKPVEPLDDEDLQTTIPMLSEDMDGDRTDPEVPLLMEDDDEDDLMPRGYRGDETAAETNVILFDDEEDLDDAAATVVRKKSPGMSSKELDTAAFDLGSDDEIVDEIMEADDDSFADESLEEVFEGDEDGLDDSFADEGMSAAEISVGRSFAPETPQSEWGGGTVFLLAFSSLFLMVGGWMACDLLGSITLNGGPTYTGPLVQVFGGFFK